MKLQKLILRNFKGIKDLVLDADGESVSIHGDNGTGKTTIADSISWLLFGKDSTGSAKFEIKTVGTGGDANRVLEHSVEATFSISGGHDIVLAKTLKEKWTKKRGSSQPGFTGNVTDYSIDGVPMPEKEFKSRISEIANEETFKLLTSPSYFADQLPWADRRRILLEICGDITDADVIKSDQNLAGLTAILTGRNLDDHKRSVMASLTKINGEIKKIPVRIDEVDRSMPKEEIDVAGAKSTLSDLNKKKTAASEKRIRLESGGEAGELKKQLAEAEGVVANIETAHTLELNEISKEKSDELVALRTAKKDQVSEIEVAKATLARIKATEIPTTEDIDRKMAELREKFTEEQAKTYAFDEEICQACGQVVPEDPNAEEKFNQRKAEVLAGVNEQGKALAAEKENIEKSMATVVADRDAGIKSGDNAIGILERNFEKVSEQIADLEKEISKITSQKADGREDHRKAVSVVNELKTQIENLSSGDTSGELAKIEEEIKTIDSEIIAANEIIASEKTKSDAKARINELKEDEKRLSADHERLSGELFLMEEFTRAKVNLLERKINSKFELARFKLFNQQVNGGLSDCCEVTFDGVPYSGGLNNGARINVGLDIIKTLSEYYGVSMPIVVDNAESVTELIPMDTQVIRLVVSEADKTLRIEKE